MNISSGSTEPVMFRDASKAEWFSNYLTVVDCNDKYVSKLRVCGVNRLITQNARKQLGYSVNSFVCNSLKVFRSYLSNSNI